MPNAEDLGPQIPVTFHAAVIGGEGAGDYAPGDIISIVADVPQDEVFYRWRYEGISLEDPRSAFISFIMPSNDVTLTALTRLPDLDPYNKISRKIDARVSIYFSSVPLVVNKTNYLISFNLLEELGSTSSSNILGDVSANSLDLKLFSPKGIFSPSNVNSPYHGMMRAGVKIVVELCANTVWHSLGEFYVNDWYAEVTSLEASVTCLDKMQSILNSKTYNKAREGLSFIQAFDDVLRTIGASYEIDPSIVGNLTWWYYLPKIADTLNNLALAGCAPVYCDTSGVIRVFDVTKPQEVKFTLTDNDQVVSATIPQSIISDFDGLDITTTMTQLSDMTQILDLKNYVVPVGKTKGQEMSFNHALVARVETVLTVRNSDQIELLNFSSTPVAIQFDFLNSLLESSETSISVWGRVIETVKKSYTAYGSRPMTFESEYCQNDAVSKRIDSILDKYVRSDLPTLEVDIRGNPAMHLGDKLRVVSERYNVDFVGILQRAEYSFEGALTCKIKLIDSRILEVTP